MNPTKKQKAMLDFIDGFIQGRGYSPTLREIMQALGYKSVSTVAKHVDNLIARGWLVKREGSARSLGVVSPEDNQPWWNELEREIEKRRGVDDKSADILQKALEIVKK